MNTLHLFSKALCITGLCLFQIHNSSAQQLPPSNGQGMAVKEVTCSNFVVTETGDKRLERQKTFEYNKAGLLTKLIIYGVDPEGYPYPQRQTVYQYSLNRNLLTISRFNASNALEWKEEYFYDEAGNKIRVEFTDSKRLKQKVRTSAQYKYDANGNMILEEGFNSEGIKISEKTWAYNDLGDVRQRTQWEIRKDSLKNSSVVFNDYDANRNLKKAVIERLDGNVSSREVRLFEGGYVKEWTTYQNGVLVSQYATSAAPKKDGKKPKAHDEWSINTEYDENGNEISKTKMANDKVLSVYNFEYDTQGNTTRILKNDTEAQKTEEQIRSFDKHNNMLSETFLLNGKAQKKDAYTYEYYE